MNQLPAWLETSPQLLDAGGMRRATVRLAHEIAEAHRDVRDVLLAGVVTRGVPLAQRLASALEELGHARPSLAVIDARGHRDDRPRVTPAEAAVTAPDGGPAPAVLGAEVIVVDDVLYTGRTLRAAIDALMEAGRPASVQALVLVDRGHRELPIRATFVGKNVPTSAADRVHVRLREVDGLDGAWLVPGAA